MKQLPPIDIKTYNYPLSDDKIANYPLEDRSKAKLLFYHSGKISHHHFYNLPDLLEEDILILRNSTKVIQARLFFQRASGALIEVFCLEPLQPFSEMSLAMQQKGECIWKCMVKNLKKWKIQEVLQTQTNQLVLHAELLQKEGRYCEVKFQWEDNITWAEVLESFGKVPLPPYIHREANTNDKYTYQTVYAREDGAVAAPTAGLHFTHALEEQLRSNNIPMHDLTLHVSAGTFQAVEVSNALEHPMHKEQILFTRTCIQALLESQRNVIAVGTTSVRAVESLYWFGAKLLQHPATTEFSIQKMEPYQNIDTPNREIALKAVLSWMDTLGINTLIGHTEIMIFPGYTFKIIHGLITNFHQPQSTLLLLVSALIGEDWKKVYDEALQHNYRFLSYGDSSLLIP